VGRFDSDSDFLEARVWGGAGLRLSMVHNVHDRGSRLWVFTPKFDWKMAVRQVSGQCSVIQSSFISVMWSEGLEQGKKGRRPEW
jgi:hypothetical protein